MTPGFYHRSQETEKRTIERIESNRKTIILNQPLEYRHLGESYTLGDRSYSLKAEVGLLTRNIRIIGVLLMKNLITFTLHIEFLNVALSNCMNM